MGVAGMGFFCLLQMVLIFTKAPNTTPKALILGYVLMALLTLVGVVIGVKNSGTNRNE